MQAVWTALPELEDGRDESISAPEGREGDGFSRVTLVELGDARLQDRARRDLHALLGGPGRKTAGTRSSGPVRGGLGVVHGSDGPGHADLAAQRRPMEDGRCVGIGGQVPALAAPAVRIETQTVVVET